MTVEERVKMVIGELTVNLQIAHVKIEELEKQLAAMNGAAGERYSTKTTPD